MLDVFAIFDVVNLSGYNIGAFTMPFVQKFLGPVGVISTSLFDVGNANAFIAILLIML